MPHGHVSCLVRFLDLTPASGLSRRKKDHGRAEAMLIASWGLGLQHPDARSALSLALQPILEPVLAVDRASAQTLAADSAKEATLAQVRNPREPRKEVSGSMETLAGSSSKQTPAGESIPAEALTGVRVTGDTLAGVSNVRKPPAELCRSQETQADQDVAVETPSVPGVQRQTVLARVMLEESLGAEFSWPPAVPRAKHGAPGSSRNTPNRAERSVARSSKKSQSTVDTREDKPRRRKRAGCGTKGGGTVDTEQSRSA
jgi:hypothetical protein